MPYKHGSNTVRAYKQYCTNIKDVSYEHRGNIVRAWIGHRSAPSVTVHNIVSCARTILCFCDLVFVRPCVLRSYSYNYILRASTVWILNTEDCATGANLSTRNSDQDKNLRTKLETRTTIFILFIRTQDFNQQPTS